MAVKRLANLYFTSFIFDMKIQANSYVNFQAHKMDFSPKVKKLNDSGEYETADASFIRFDLNNMNDKIALKEIGENWVGARYIADICSEADWADEYEFYAITSQHNDFNHLNAKKILSICSIDSSCNYIDYMQSNPDCIYKAYPKYKGSGSALLKSLQTHFTYLAGSPIPDEDVIDFYIRNDFKPQKPNDYSVLEWGNK